jgi:predicted nucleic acid-binding protein
LSVTFDTNILYYATVLDSDRSDRARDVIERAMRADAAILILQTLVEFSSIATRKAGLSIDRVRSAISDWRAVLEVEAAVEADLYDALKVVGDHRLPFWDALLWASARRVGVRHLLSEDFQDGRRLGGVRFVNPFTPANDRLIDEILPPWREISDES